MPIFQKRGRAGPTAQGDTVKTKKTSIYDAAFEQLMIDNGVYPSGYEALDGSDAPEPANMSDIQNRPRQRRESLSSSRFPDTTFARFKKANRNAESEARTMADVRSFGKPRDQPLTP